VRFDCCEEQTVDLSHPLAGSLLLPLVVALVLTGAMRWGLGERIGVPLAAMGAGVGLLVALITILGEPVLPPRTGLQKLPLLVTAYLVVGVTMTGLAPRRQAFYAALLPLVALSALWLAWPQLTPAEAAVLIPLVLASLIGVGALVALREASADGVNAPGMLIAATLGLAGAAFNAGSLALFQAALAIAAAVGGFALWSWPRPRLPFSSAGLLPSGVGGLCVALLILLLTDIRPWALLPLALVFLGDLVARRLPVPGRFSRASVEPLYIVALAALPVAASIWLAQPPLPADSPYYR
jgi:hypothetical protein